jgi:membrane complex biogenesis BtpA family protein
MVHLAPLPGSPGFGGSMEAVVDRARQDAAVLAGAGFPALMVENFGDAPFFAEEVPLVTVAAMARVLTELRAVTPTPIGVNVLRNDGVAAVAVAAATGADLIRVNVLSGLMYTDQGPIVGRAAEVARARRELAPGIEVLADVFVKHAAPPAGLTIEQAAVDTWERGGATALVVSGAGTGAALDLDEAARVKRAVPGAPLLAGSGATPDSLARLAEVVDGVIVGSALKVDGRATGPVDPARADALATAAAALGWI